MADESNTEIIKKIQNDIKKLQKEINGCKGHISELYTYRKIERLCGYGIKFLFNLFLPDVHGDKRTREIDLLVISDKCLFVIENKSKKYPVIIIEDGLQNPYSAKSKPEDNPIQQNKKNIENLCAIIGNDVPICNLVVYDNKTVLDSVEIKSKNTYVMNNGRLCEFMQWYLSRHRKCKSVNVMKIYNQLIKYEKMNYTGECGKIFGTRGELFSSRKCDKGN